MTKKDPTPEYTTEFRKRAVKIYRKQRPKYTTDTAAYEAIALELDCSPDALRTWLSPFEKDFHQLSDCEQARWPDNWFQNFGPYAFFYVVGLRGYIIENCGGPITPSSVAEKLIAYKNDIFSANPNFVLPNGSIEKSFSALEYKGEFFSLVTPKLLAIIHQSNCRDMNYLDCIVRNRFDNLTRANIRNAYSGTCITFPAALLVYLAIQFLALDNCRPADNIQIRFAGYRIPNFDVVFSKMELRQKLELSARIGSKLSQNGDEIEIKVLSQLASGRPVTKPLACTIADFLNNLYPKNPPIFSVQPYQLRTDIPSNEKKPAKGENTFTTFQGWPDDHKLKM